MQQYLAGVENAGVCRMERQPEILCGESLKLLRYTCPYSSD